MRATRPLFPVLRTAFGRRSSAALIVVTLLTAGSQVTVAQSVRDSLLIHVSSQSLLGESLLGQVGAARNRDKNKPAPPPKKAAVQTDPALLRDKTALPEGYEVPPATLPDIEIRKELPFPKKDDPKDPEWKKHVAMFREYNSLLRKGSLRDPRAERELLRYGIKFRLAQMTQVSLLSPSDEDREKIAEAQAEGKRVEAPPTIEYLRDQLLSDLRDTNALNGIFEVRDAFIEILCEEAPKLLDNNFYVRFNVAEILSSINNRDQDNLKGIAEVPGFKVIKTLIDLINDPNQHPLYKLHPVQALAKCCRHKDCKPEDRFAIIECLMKQMVAAKQLPEWYGMRLAEALGQLGEPYDRTRQPVVVDALVNVLKDSAYTYRVRVQAAHSLGRINLENYSKTDEIAVEILRLSSQMGRDFEKDRSNPRWRLYFAWLYLAFQPMDATERTEKKGLIGQVDSKPNLAPTKTVVTEAYQLFLPLAQNALGTKGATPVTDQLRKISAWLDARPKNAGNPVAAGTN